MKPRSPGVAGVFSGKTTLHIARLRPRWFHGQKLAKSPSHCILRARVGKNVPCQAARTNSRAASASTRPSSSSSPAPRPPALGAPPTRPRRSFQRPELSLPSWRARTDCCRWEGVTCGAAPGPGRGTVVVMALDLGGRGLRSRAGLDGGSLFRLATLRRLSLAGNDFGGAGLPAAGFESLAELTHLNLSGAGFAGQVPAGIGALRKLVSLDLSSADDGQLTSLAPLGFNEPTIGAVVANLTSLRELRLDGVGMSAAAAGDWCAVLADSTPRLRVLTMQSCNLSGPICPSLSRLRSLAVVDLSNNNQGYSDDGSVIALSGPIPEFFAEFQHLTVLQLPRLRVLVVSSNYDLAGSLPELPAGSSLEVLNLRETKFCGQIPSSIGNLKHLKTLDISGTNGSGGIPASIGDLASLSFLDLSSSGFQIGELPAAIGRLQSLSTLRLIQCGISGEIPTSFANLTSLTELDLSLFRSRP